MGKLKSFFLISSVLIAVLGVVLHYYHPPALMSVLYAIPGVKEWTQKIHFYTSFSFWGLKPKKQTKDAEGEESIDWAKLMEDQGLSVDDDLQPERIFTAEMLAKASGVNGKILLSILGRVYDVSEGKDHYGPGGGYEFFAGKDATRAFVTGDFTPEGLTDDIDGLSDADLRGLDDWSKFYDREYSYAGKLVGRFYDKRGQPTEYLEAFNAGLRRAFKSKDADDARKRIFPPCNSEWKQGAGGRVWCSNKSGGVEREWAGVPRKLYEPGTSQFRCACVRNKGPPSKGAGGGTGSPANSDNGDLSNPNLMEYPDCPKDSESCTTE